MKMKSYLLIVCLSFLALLTNAQTTVVKWTFDDDNLVADAGIEANAAKTISAVATAQNFTYPAGLNSTHSLSETGWNSGINTKFWLIDFTTIGYQNLTISSYQRSSSTGPKDFKIQYKIGESGTWNDVTSGNIVVATDFVAGVVNNLSLPTECNNQASVFIRYLITSTTPVSNGDTVATGGTSRIEDLEIKGVEMGGSDLTPPAFTATYPKVQSLTETSFDLAVQLNEAGTAYYQVLSDGAVAPTVSELITNGTSIAVANANTTYTAAVLALTAQTAYDVYVVAQDDETTPNVQASVTLLNVMTLGGVITSDLFFSEYIEGSGSNKAIEIYNPSDVVVDLSNYVLKQSHDGKGWIDADTTPSYLLNLTGTIQPHDVYVLYATGTDVSSAIVAQGDWTAPYGVGEGQTKIVYFNGNDAMGLFKNNILIDVFGDPDVNVNFNAAGISGASLDHTVVRKFSVQQGNPDWSVSAGTDADNSEWIVYPVNTFNYLGYHGLSPAAEITAFSFAQQTGVATIDAVNATIAIEVGNGTDVTTLVPTIVVSPGAQVSPTSGVAVDFTNPVVYRVTAENMVAYKDWTVTVTVASVSSETDITGFVLAQQTGAAVIDTANHTVTCEVAEGTDLTHLAPAITLSYGATVVPASGDTIDFSAGPVTYTVTAEDGLAIMDWSVTVTEQQIIIIPIHDIQFTEDASGNSPLAGQTITSQGIVTGILTNTGFFIQDQKGPWNGIYVYKGSNPNITIPQLGDFVKVTGVVYEFSNLTEFSPTNTIEVLSSGNQLPEMDTIDSSELNESYECVLARFENVMVDTVDQYGNYYGHSVATSHILLVGDEILTPLPVDPNSTYNFSGPVYFRNGEFKVLPRFAADIDTLTSVNNPPVIANVATDPELPMENHSVDVYANISDNDLVEVHFYYGLSEDNISIEIEMTEIMPGQYKAVVPGYALNTRVHFKFTASDVEQTVEYVSFYDVLTPDGIGELNMESVKLYPNPVHNYLVIGSALVEKVIISNLLGSNVVEAELNGENQKVDVSALSSGVYMVTLVDLNGNRATQRIVKN